MMKVEHTAHDHFDLAAHLKPSLRSLRFSTIPSIFSKRYPCSYTLMVKSTSEWSWLMRSRLVNEYLPAAELICEADYQPIVLQQVFS